MRDRECGSDVGRFCAVDPKSSAVNGMDVQLYVVCVSECVCVCGFFSLFCSSCGCAGDNLSFIRHA